MKKTIFLTLVALFAVTMAVQAQTQAQAQVLQDSLIATPLTGGQSQEQSIDMLWGAANDAFVNEQYPLAVTNYEAIREKGFESAELYYNLGNSYFHQNQLGKSILNYMRAQILAPSNEDVEYNLEIAKARTKDKIEPVPQFFVQRWFVSIADIFATNTWAIIALIMFLCTALSIILWLVSAKLPMRKLGFSIAVISAILTVTAISYSAMTAGRQFNNLGAVVINNAAPVKSSPSAGGKDLFVLHEGTVVQIEEQFQQWSEIRIEDGNKGWVLTSAIEQI